MEVTLIRIATCCCGQASIEVEGDPEIHLVCHCNNCKKRTGSAFGISAYFANTQVRNVKGEMSIYIINNDSTVQKRHYCNSCGTTLYWNIARFHGIPGVSKMTGIAGSCFIDKPLPDPTIMSFSAEKCAWVELLKLKLVGPNK